MEKIRVLHILDELNTGGAEKIVVSYYQNINRDTFQWDFIITQYDDPLKKGRLESVVENLGGHIYRVTRKRKNYIKNILETSNIIKNGSYDIVHSHLDELSAFYLLSAKKANVPVRICHSHLAGASRGTMVEIICKFMKPILNKVVTDKFACGIDAGKSLWGEKSINNKYVHIMRNAIMTDKFEFDQFIRENMRRELGISDRFVIGTVGRLSYQKNSLFLIDIIEKIRDKCSNALLLVVGEGDELSAMQNLIEEKRLRDSVIFLGSRDDVNKLMMAFDIFVLPSRFEGLPIVLVEAQCTGIPCLISDKVTKEIKINKNVRYISIENNANKWAEACLEYKDLDRESDSIKKIREYGYEIQTAARDLENYYIEALRRSKI